MADVETQKVNKPENPEKAENQENPEEKNETGKQKLYYSWWQKKMQQWGFVVTPKVKKPVIQNVLEWTVTIVGALVLVLLLYCFVGMPVIVDGNSMYPTLHHGEVMIVSKFHYGTSYLFNTPITLGGEPERFDVVVCQYPDRGTTKFVKRVVGLPGDTVEISGGYLYVNGKKYEEKFLQARMVSNYGPYTVPEGEYFLMGDNRNNSNDSRNAMVGSVPREMILGRVEGVLWHQIPATLEDWGLKE